MARWNNPLAAGIAIRVCTLAPPPDSPWDEYPIGIAAERLDVVTHPPQSGDEIELTGISRLCESTTEIAEMAIAQYTQAVVERYAHHVLMAGRDSCRRCALMSEPAIEPPIAREAREMK